MSEILGVIDDSVREKYFKPLEELSLFGDRIKYLILSSRGILQNPIEVSCEDYDEWVKYLLFVSKEITQMQHRIINELKETENIVAKSLQISPKLTVKGKQ